MKITIRLGFWQLIKAFFKGYKIIIISPSTKSDEIRGQSFDMVIYDEVREL